MTTPNEILEWALRRLNPNEADPPYPGPFEVRHPDTEAFEVVNERLTQAEMDVEFYRKHYKGDPPLDDCKCGDCNEDLQ